MKQVQLFIENKEVDLFGDESFVLSFAIDEISDIGRKSAGYSKEINIPATDNNNKVFTNLFEVNIEGGFNPISRKTAVLFVDGVRLMQGFFKLNSITIRDGQYVTYKGLLYEDAINFIDAIEPFNLDNLSLPVDNSISKLVSGTLIGELSLTGINSSFVGKINGVDINEAIDYAGVTFSSATYGDLQPQARTSTLPTGAVWSPSTMNAYRALSDQIIELRGSFFLQSTQRATYKYRVIKSDYNTPLSGTFTDYVIYEGTAQSSPVNSGSSVITIQILTQIQLKTNDRFRIELYEETGINFTVNIGTAVSGDIYTVTSTTIPGFTVNTQTILNTINDVENSDDGVIAFPIIDYGEKYKLFNFRIGGNQNTPTNNQLLINADNMRPWVYVKRVFDEIFNQAGFTYRSTFLNSSYFKSLIMGGGINDDDIEGLMYSAYVNPSHPTGEMVLSNTNDTQVLNNANQVVQYNYRHRHMSDVSTDITPSLTKLFKSDVAIDQYVTPAPSKTFINVKAHNVEYANTGGISNYYGYKVPESDSYGLFLTPTIDGKYRVHAKLSFTSYAAYEASNPSILYDYQTTHVIQLQRLKIGSYKYYPNSSTAPEFSKWEVLKETRREAGRRAKNTSPQTHVLEIDETVTLTKGDILRVVIIGDPNRQGFPTNSTFTKLGAKIVLDDDQDNTFLKFYRKGTLNGATFSNAASLLPKNVKQSDFILNISRLFNLYFEPDKQNPKELLIEPRDMFYNTGNIINIDNEIDYAKDFNIEILSHNTAKNNVFKYADDDKDYLSTEYAKLANNGLNFGAFRFESFNEYNRDTNTLQSLFAPSFLQQVPGTNIKLTKIHDPKIYEQQNATNVQPNFQIKPRILFYKKQQFGTDFRVSIGNLLTASYVPFASVGTTNTNVALFYDMLEYGYAGHLDDPNTPQYDLNWFTDFNYLPDITTGTTANLFNVFYRRQMIELTDQTARRVICFVNLSPTDIANLEFKNIYFFKKDYWRLQSIEDFDTSSDVNQTTRCTFVKVVNAQTNYVIDYAAFGFLGLTGGTAGGLTGTPISQTPIVAIDSGTSSDIITWDTINEINNNKNKLKYDLTKVSTVINVPGEDYASPLLDDNTADIAYNKDITINIQQNVDDVKNIVDNIILDLNPGNVILYNETNYPSTGETIDVQTTDSRMLVQTTDPTYASAPASIILPPVTGLQDGYQFSIAAELSANALFTVSYLDGSETQVDLFTTDSPLQIFKTTSESNNIIFQYWEATGGYIIF